MRYVLAGVGLLAVLLVLAGVKFAQISTLIEFGKAAAQTGPPPEVVSSAVAREQSWEQVLHAVASVASARGVVLSNEVPGVVTRLHFASGALVRRGDLLLELDTQVENAQLRALRARRDLARTSRKRSRALVVDGAVPRAQVDADESAFASLTAEVAALEAQIGRKAVRAPFTGRLGLREVDLGQFLAPGTRIAALESTDAVYVDFTLPQQDLGRLAVGMAVRATAEGSEGPPLQGTIAAIEPTVDAATRAVRVRATVPAEEGRLLPGMFLQLAVVLPQVQQVVAVPQTAIVHAPYGDSVFLVAAGQGPAGQPTKIARQQFVRLGEARGDFVAVLQGLRAGQEVVVAGAFKLRNGTPIVVDNRAVRLEPELAPRPQNR